MVGVELFSQLAGFCPPSVVPQYIVTVDFSLPIVNTFPFKVALVVSILVAAVMAIVGAVKDGVVKLNDEAGHPVPIEFVGIRDEFGQSGTPDELIERYGMDEAHIKEAVKKVLQRKQSLRKK